MEMHQVRSFLAVAKHLNFTRAAQELRVAQPSLTRAIQKLECELEGPLFRRERSNTHLTELGRLMLPHLHAALAAAESAKTQARRLKAQDFGSLVLGVDLGVEGSRVASLVTQTARRFTCLDVSVQMTSTDEVERRLLEGEFDAAILAPVAAVSERFDLRLVDRDELVVAVPRGHRLAMRESVALTDLDAEPLITRQGCRFDEALAGVMTARGLTRLVRHCSNDTPWLAEFVRQGLGCAVLPAATAIANGLTHRRLDGVSLQHRTMLATVPGRRHSAALAALIQQAGTRERSAIRAGDADPAPRRSPQDQAAS